MKFLSLKVLRKPGELKCPACNVSMIPYSCENVVVDKCPECDGIWFDNKELIVFRNSLREIDLSNIQVIYKPPEPDVIHIKECPRCRDLLYEAKYGESNKVKFERCGKCQGIWMPIHQTLNLIELVRLGQVLAEDIKGFVRERQKEDQSIRNYHALRKVGEASTMRIPYPLAVVWYWVPWLVSFPLYDNNPRKIFPLATVGLIALNVILFFVPDEWSNTFGLIPQNVLNGESLYTFFTSMFTHAGYLHLLGNMFYLWTFGDNIEEKLARSRYLLIFFLCGLVATMAHIVGDVHSQRQLVGASGAISGILGAYLIIFPHITVKTFLVGRLIDVPVWMYLGGWFLIQLLSAGLYASLGLQSSVAWYAHIGGFIAGGLIAKLLKRNSDLANFS